MEFDFFGFDDESEALSKTEKIIDHSLRSSDEEDDEGDGPTETHMAETKAFWDSQNQSLQVIHFSFFKKKFLCLHSGC